MHVSDMNPLKWRETIVYKQEFEELLYTLKGCSPYTQHVVNVKSHISDEFLCI